MSLERPRPTREGYDVRRFEPGDRDGVLSLFERQWGERPSDAWFDWKFVEDPYLSHVPITLAERDGEIVAVQGYLPYPVRRGNRTFAALKPVDAVVHPDHRRKGLYSRITERAIEVYRDREPAFFFNFPNVASLGAQENLGWTEVDVVPMYYRIQRPQDFLSTDRLPAPLERATAVPARAYTAARGLFASGESDADVERYASVPADLLASLSETRVPEEFHVRREAQFYRWVFDAPNYDHTTYVARRGGDPVAALVTRTATDRTVKVMDALPTTGDRDALADLLAAVVADNRAASALTVANRILPEGVLARYGFVGYHNPVLSRVCDPTYMAVRPLWGDEESGPIPRRALTESENWRVSFVEVTD